MLYNLKGALRPGRGLLPIVSGYFYDAYRACRYGGWTYWQRHDLVRRDHLAAKIYHSIEKGLAFRQRRAGSGWAAIDRFIEHIKQHGGARTHHERIGCEVALKFLDSEPSATPRSERARHLPIKPEHTIMMMLAVGYANETLKVCSSPQIPREEYTTFIEAEKEGARNV